jgi:Leucine-rich repeat (LRR) protein
MGHLENGLQKCFAAYSNDILCDFIDHPELDYNCFVKNFEASEVRDYNYFGKHLLDKFDADVLGVLFRDSKFPKLSEEICKKFPKVQEIDADFTALNSIESLKDCGLLERFKASHNNIEYFHHETFAECAQLKLLNLSHGKILNFPGQLFKTNQNLVIVDFSYNSIERLEASNILSSNLLKLEHLNLESNRIRIIDADFFSECQNVKTLNLRNNLLENFDDDVFEDLENLEKLDLSSNKLAILSDLAFRKNLKLEIISLASNYISQIHPKAFQNLRDLKFLDLRGNLCVNEVFEENWDPE